MTYSIAAPKEMEDRSLAPLIEGIGAKVIVQQPSWPAFYHKVKDEHPEAMVVHCPDDMSCAREVSGYLGETAFTRYLPLFTVDIPRADVDRFRRRARRATLVSASELVRELKALQDED